MILTREVGSLEAWCRRATAHDMRIQSAVVTVVQVLCWSLFSGRVNEKTALSRRPPARYGLFVCLHYGSWTRAKHAEMLLSRP